MDTYAEGTRRADAEYAREPGRWQAARLIQTIASVIVAFIVLSIIFRVAGANQSNGIVNFVTDIGGWFATPFKGIFNLDSFKAQTALNWGIGAVVYAFIGTVLARIVAR